MNSKSLLSQYLWRWKSRGIRVRHGGGKKGSGGPVVKLQRLNQYFPEHQSRYNLIYACYGFIHENECRDAKLKKIPVVYHMNSCWHPFFVDQWKKENRKFIHIHNELSNFIIYGSRFAKEGAKQFLGTPKVESQIIYNGVDLDLFTPGVKSDRPMTLLIAGRHDLRHRIEPMLMALPLLLKDRPQTRLLIAGECLEGEGLRNCSRNSFADLLKEIPEGVVEWLAPYTQIEAPDLYRRADILIHLKQMDWTPNVVAEAMACGLPVVHTGNGGLPELVDDAGVGLGLEMNWERIQEVDVEMLVKAILTVDESRSEMSKAARRRAEEEFSLQKWMEKHLQIFRNLLKQ